MKYDPPVTGGCQCGAVRFRFTETLARASICHCRMCQKAFGSYFAPLVSTAADGFEITRGEPAFWRSSNISRRGFCATCGTPLFFWDDDGAAPEVALGALDDPGRIRPEVQVGVSSRADFVRHLLEIPERETGPGSKEDENYARITSYQHPDHDTAEWPEPEPAP
jgi:hypothetical protein